MVMQEPLQCSRPPPDLRPQQGPTGLETLKMALQLVTLAAEAEEVLCTVLAVICLSVLTPSALATEVCEAASNC